MGFGDRDVVVRLGLSVRDYVAGGAAAEGVDRRLIASQAALGASTKRLGDDLDDLGKKSEKNGREMGRGLLVAAGGLAALGAAGGAIKLLPPLIAVAGTGAAALPGILGGAINSALVLKVGLAGISKELGAIYKVKDPFSRLTPNARNFLSQAERIRPTVQGLQSDLQSRVMQGTGADLQLLATKTLPAVRGQLGALADDWSATFAEIALSLSDKDITDAFNTVTGGADRFFDQVNSRIRPTAHALATLVSESEPVADAVGKSLIGMLDRFDAKVEEARRSGSLAKFFEAGADAAREMADIGGDVLRITGMVVSETAKQSTAIGGAADKLNAYMASGRAGEDIAGIVHTLTVAYDGLAATVGPLAGVLRDAFADPGTAQSIQQMFLVLSAGSQALSTIVQLVLGLNAALGGAPLTILAFVFAMQKMQVVVTAASAAAVKGATAMQAYGGAVESAGKKLPGLVGGLGKAAVALVALDAAHSVIESFKDDAVDVDGLAKAVEHLGKTGEVTGALTFQFGENLDDIGVQLQMLKGEDNWFGGLIASGEKALPITGDLATLLGSPATFSGSEENITSLDQSLTAYAKKTGDTAAVQAVLNKVIKASGFEWADLQKFLPQTTAQLGQMSIESMRLETGTAGLAARQELLNTPLKETVTIGRSLLDVYNELNGTNLGFASAIAAAEEAVDGLSAGLKKNGLALDKNKTGFDLTSAKGRANLEVTKALTTSAAAAAQAKLDEKGTIEQAGAIYDRYINQLRRTLALQGASPATIAALVAEYTKMPAALEGASHASNSLNGSLKSIPKHTTFVFDGKSLIDAKGRTLELKDGIKGIPAGKSFTWNGHALVDGKGKAYALKAALDDLPKHPTITPKVDTTSAATSIAAIDHRLQMLDGKTATTYVRTVPKGFTGIAPSGTKYANADGGVYRRPAADGLVQAQVAPPGTLYQWAEPETQGEAFIPRKGNKRRSRAILGEAAEWYGMQVVPMAAGGIRIKQAAAGLVNTAPLGAGSPPATRLDFAESYTQARAAVVSLNSALKQNGRSFSAATQKGQENRGALYQVIRASQDAATTKFKETGSVAAANAAYDQYIARLRKLLHQQRINSAVVRQLLSLAQRPTYDTAVAAPKNSTNLVAAARSQIAAAGGIESLRDALSLNKASTSMGSQESRDNLSGILDFLGQAGAAAQDRYAQSGSSKLATALYYSYVAQLRKALGASGYSRAAIDKLITAYGRITLAKNAQGGVHYAAAGVMSLDSRSAGVYPSSKTLYGFAEPGTGGEAFIPRNGDRRRGRELVDVAAGWYGGRFAPAGAGGGGGDTTINNSMTITPLSYNPSTTELLSYQRQLDAQARVGRRR